LGTVREVVHAPASDLLVVETDRGEVLVPFVRAIVPEVDLAGGRVVLDPPAGLLD
ncbi:MAG: PRC-barrel domain-containing protein, partial [Pseudonocardiaceae bacterium]